MKVQLRNKDGQLCNLKEFCTDEPQALVPEPRNMQEAAELLPVMKANLIEMKRLIEVIKAFNIPRKTNHSMGGLTVKILSDGTYAINMARSTAGTVLTEAAHTVKRAEEDAKKWEATYYEVSR